MTSPCMDCMKRSATCHASCEEYLFWAQKVKEQREKKHQSDVAFYGFVRNGCKEFLDRDFYRKKVGRK